jgi:hypothetical protein
MMLGEGMPWTIILIFFVAGVLLGINSGRNDLKKMNPKQLKS